MIICLLGKGASGKDTTANMLYANIPFERLPQITSRPRREGEGDGTYCFLESDGTFRRNNAVFDILDNEPIEKRVYQSAHGEWMYGTLPLELKDIYGNTHLTYHPLINFNTLATVSIFQAQNYVEAFGAKKIHIIYLSVNKQTLESRILARDKNDVKEAMRRLEADNKDYNTSNLGKLKRSCKFDTIRVKSTDTPEDVYDKVYALLRHYGYIS